MLEKIMDKSLMFLRFVIAFGVVYLGLFYVIAFLMTVIGLSNFVTIPIIASISATLTIAIIFATRLRTWIQLGLQKEEKETSNDAK